MTKNISIIGAGLVGSLLSVLLKQKGHNVTIYERRPDMRRVHISAGKSINMAMSERGWQALVLAGLRDKIEDIAIPMYGRFLHQQDGTTAFQAYGKNNEAIYSVSRAELNMRLMTAAEEAGVNIHFESRCEHIDIDTNALTVYQQNNVQTVDDTDILFGADGAFSVLRNTYVKRDRISSDQTYIEHGYKELVIPPGENGTFLLEKNALHIWPRRNFMLIALPNPDGNFTCTLFLPFEGEHSFASLQTEVNVRHFFETFFPDALPLMPTLVEDFFARPAASLVTTSISDWRYKDKSILIGDAAHAIVPFYGQGMNAGFEDCSVLMQIIDQYGNDWEKIFTVYHQKRKQNGDAVRELALMNFIEMRDKVADPHFLLRKKIEQDLGRRYPDAFISIYEMVSFTHIPYAIAMQCIAAQDALLGDIMAKGDYFSNIENPAFVAELEKQMQDYKHHFNNLLAETN